MEQPLVSVVVGVFNKERYVGECLQSVLAQTYSRFELIVVDDASTDRSVAVVRELGDPRIRSVVRAVNSGRPAVPRNEGIRLATGEFVAFLDADDLWMPDKLEKQLAYLKLHPEYPLVHGACLVMDGEGRSLHLRHGGRLPPAGDCLLPLLEHCWISISTVLARKELVDRVGLFDENPALRAREDYDWLLRAARLAPFGVMADCVAKYRVSDASISHVGGNWRAAPRDFLSHRDSLRQRERWRGRVSARRVAEIAFRAAEENAWFWRDRNEFGRAAWFAWQMLRLAPFRTGGWRQLLAAGLRRGHE